MRTDKAGAFFDDGSAIGAALEAMILKGASLSGHERNRVFMQTRRGGVIRYADASIISGLDAIGDGRSFAWFDMNHDGRRDVALTNANVPRVQLLRNQHVTGHRVLALRLVGAKTDAQSTPGGASNRDAIGARVEVVAGGLLRVAELRAGEGLAAQNSAELLIGLGDASEVESIRVRWPSGRETALSRPPIEPQGRTALTLTEP